MSFGPSLVGTFTDGNTSASLSDFTGVIDWGDGSPNSVATFVSFGGGDFGVFGAHTYSSPDDFAVTTNVFDAGGSTTTVNATITVTDLPVSGAVNNFTAVEGKDTGTIVLATFTDPNTLATVASVTASLPVGGWGDGLPTAITTLTVTQIGVTPLTAATDPGDPIFEITGSHTYAEEGTFTVNINVTTIGGVVTALTRPGDGHSHRCPAHELKRHRDHRH